MRRPGGYHATPTRRQLLQAASAALLNACTPARSCQRERPHVLWGVQSGDVGWDRGVVWCRADRASRMVVEWSSSPSFERSRVVAGPIVTAETGFVGKAPLTGLPSGTRIHYRARFDDSPWERGSFATPPLEPRDVLLAWSGDTNGQGFGIDPARGGMPAYSALLARKPDLFIHCGDTIYADEPIPPSVRLSDGTVWNNVVDPAKDHVAQTLEDFRGAHLYPRRSAEVRALSAEVPLFAIWDDHEVRNNWFPGQLLTDPRYADPRVDVLVPAARRAFSEHMPTLAPIDGPMYRVVPWGPLVDVFLLDGRSHRTPNEPAPAEGGLLGAAEAAWLLDALARSKAPWKIVACDMPIALSVSERGRIDPWAYDGWANEDGEPKGREVELARLLSGLKARRVKNVLWLTADVHYAAAHRFDPSRARFSDFDPFWELVAGPMHATAFPRKKTDDTFGPEVEWVSADWDTFGSPGTFGQTFGLVRIDARTLDATATFVDGRGNDLHRLVLPFDRS